MSSDIKTTTKPRTSAKKKADEFVHLHNHTHYSLLDGLQKIKPMLDKIESLGQSAVAITDHGSLSGAIEFYKECTARQIKPIIGIETYVAPRKYTDKDSAEDRNPFHLILLAKNQQGYKNLMKLSTIASLEGFYYKPRIDHDLLAKYHKGLICLSGCVGGEVANAILAGDTKKARLIARWYNETFGADHYYLEMQPRIEWEPQKKVNEELKKISAELNIPLVATGDAHYTNITDRHPHEILLCVQTGSTMQDANRMKMEMDLYIQSGEEFAEVFSDVPEAIANTKKIAQMCNLTITLGEILIPKFEVPAGQTEKSYLRSLVFSGAMWRYGGVAREDISLIDEEKARSKLPAEVLERIDYELEVIGRMGYEGYYLIVADMLNWAKNHGIVCGPGRGSGAGSIIAYVTNITELDPLKYDLLFERFLNPDRISMPDFDMDYADDRREEVIDYVTKKYGQDRVAQIITFGTMAARNAVRDAGRVLGHSYGDIDEIAKLIPPPVQGRHQSLRDTVGLGDPAKASIELTNRYKKDPRAKEVIDIAIQLEGTIRNAGTHAAGVVIAPDNLVEFVPLTRASKGGIATQYSMGPIEELGLLKFDFLGLSNLTIIKNALRIIKRVYNQEIDISKIPLDDAKTFELLSNGDTTGVFQLESAGMKRYIRELKPDKFDDIVAMVALYRPGPMQWIDDFIRRKHNPNLVHYDNKYMESSLKDTYGVIVYQEQVMQLSKEMCGFSGGQADTLRKGIGKKKPEILAQLKKDFIEGAIKTSGVEQAWVEDLWKSLEDFAAYCFPKAHAACYALVALWTAYLKAHFPSAFMAALMTSDYGDLDRIAIEVTECRHMGIELLPPDINESYAEFAVVPDNDNIRFGLKAIKNVGKGPIESILLAREDGPFESIEDFARRVDPATVLNRKTFESLIKAGCFDALADRDVLLISSDKIVAYASRAQKNALTGQIDIFGSLGSDIQLPSLQLDQVTSPTSEKERLSWEKELLGLYVSTHPLQEIENYLLSKTANLASLTKDMDGKQVVIGGIVVSVRKINTKNNAVMAFVKLENTTGEIEVIVFPRVFEASLDLLTNDSIVEISGKLSARDRNGVLGNEVKLLASRIKAINTEKAKKVPRPPIDEKIDSIQSLTIRIADLADTTQLIAIKHLLEEYPGQTTTYLMVGDQTTQRIRLPFRVSYSPQLVQALTKLAGRQNVLTTPSLDKVP